MAKVSTFKQVPVGGTFGSCEYPYGFYVKLEENQTGLTDNDNAVRIRLDNTEKLDYEHFYDPDMIVLEKPLLDSEEVAKEAKEQFVKNHIEDLHDDYPLIDVLTLGDLLDTDSYLPTFDVDPLTPEERENFDKFIKQVLIGGIESLNPLTPEEKENFDNFIQLIQIAGPENAAQLHDPLTPEEKENFDDFIEEVQRYGEDAVYYEANQHRRAEHRSEHFVS